jgi:hypothetical protein
MWKQKNKIKTKQKKHVFKIQARVTLSSEKNQKYYCKWERKEDSYLCQKELL